MNTDARSARYGQPETTKPTPSIMTTPKFAHLNIDTERGTFAANVDFTELAVTTQRGVSANGPQIE